MLNNLCPCCGRHCDLENPSCERGRTYAKTGVIPNHEHTFKGDKPMEEQKKRYLSLDQNNKLIWNIRDLGHTIRQIAEGKASQSRILIILKEIGSITQSELTERLGVQPGTASEVIGKLENANLIVRIPSEKDHRTTDIRLTEEGICKANEALEQRNKRHDEMFSCLSEEDKQRLLMLLEKVNHDWRHRYGEASEGRRHHGKGHHAHKGEHHRKA